MELRFESVKGLKVLLLKFTGGLQSSPVTRRFIDSLVDSTRLGSFADQQFLHRDFLELADEYMMKARRVDICRV